VPFLIVLYFLILGLAALLAEMILPVIFSVAFPVLNVLGFGSALVPLLVIYASLELGDERAPLLACALGLLLDLNSSHHLGSSVLLLGLLSLLIVSQAGKPLAHLWVFRLMFVLVGTFSYLVLDYLITQIELDRWDWPLAAWSKITFASLLNLILFPLFFYLAGLLPRLCGWKPVYEANERRFRA
jgi:cell shape-determining protein MreD